MRQCAARRGSGRARSRTRARARAPARVRSEARRAAQPRESAEPGRARRGRGLRTGVRRSGRRCLAVDVAGVRRLRRRHGHIPALELAAVEPPASDLEITRPTLSLDDVTLPRPFRGLPTAATPYRTKIPRDERSSLTRAERSRPLAAGAACSVRCCVDGAAGGTAGKPRRGRAHRESAERFRVCSRLTSPRGCARSSVA